MKILIDTSALEISRAGVSFYIIELMRSLKELPYGLQVEGKSYKPFFSRKSKLRAIDSIYRDTIWQDVRMNPHAKATYADIVHYPAFNLPRYAKGPTVVTIHDLYSLRKPDNFSVWHRTMVNKQIRRAVRSGQEIIVPSRFTKQEILDLFPEANPAKIHAIHSGIPQHRFKNTDADAFAVLNNRLSLQEGYILSVSTIEPRKNFSSLIRAFAAVRHEIPCKLVLAGQSGWKNADVHEQIRKLGLEDRVVFTGYVSDEELNLLYSHAECFVFPSMYEGFGFTPLEAMKCGCPVISSNATCMPEVLGAAAWYVDPFNTEEMGSRIMELCHDKNKQQQMRSDGLLQAAGFTWEKTAEETYRVYRQIITG